VTTTTAFWENDFIAGMSTVKNKKKILFWFLINFCSLLAFWTSVNLVDSGEMMSYAEIW